MAVDALPSHDSLASLTLPLPLPPPPTLLLPVEIKSCERHIELAVRRRPIRRRAVASPASRIGRRCIECGASALSIARNLNYEARALSLSLVLSSAPLPLRSRAPPAPSHRRVVRFSRAEEREQLPRTEKIVLRDGAGRGADSIDRWTSRKMNEFKNVNSAARYRGRRRIRCDFPARTKSIQKPSDKQTRRDATCPRARTLCSESLSTHSPVSPRPTLSAKFHSP